MVTVTNSQSEAAVDAIAGEMVSSEELLARVLDDATGEVCAHLSEVYGTSVSKETISTITDRVLDSFTEW